jgi:Alpha-1,4-glucan:maltose-1-phosphate maltosyltransferase, domain N/S
VDAAAAATAESRIVISGISPAIDDGRFPAKRIVGEQVAVEADIFSDSHPVISEEIVWRADDEEQWRHARMHLLSNDRWRAVLELPRVGRYRFAAESWLDPYASFARDLAAKRDAPGFDLREAEALPGREEYLNSEKYEIKHRNWNAPGNIIGEISQLNRLRRAESALQSHLGLSFYNAFNEHILYYGKAASGQHDRILVAVSLDPHNAQEADFEIP